jgi:hypothetical protein
LPSRRKDLIDKNFHARIGKVVVDFGQLEGDIRASTSGSICPAINEFLSDSILARTRFTELVDLYTFFVSYAVREALEHDVINDAEKVTIQKALDALRKDLLSVNERRNTVVHSAYREVDHYDSLSARAPSKRTIEAEKPVLHRRALEYTDPGPFKNLDLEIDALIVDMANAHQTFMTFDRSIIPYVNYVWDLFCARVTNEMQRPPVTKARAKKATRKGQ